MNTNGIIEQTNTETASEKFNKKLINDATSLGQRLDPRWSIFGIYMRYTGPNGYVPIPVFKLNVPKQDTYIALAGWDKKRESLAYFRFINGEDVVCTIADVYPPEIEKFQTVEEFIKKG